MAFPSHDLNTDNVKAKSALENVQKKYGFIPSLFNFMAEAPESIEAYMNLADIINKTSLTPRQIQLIQLAISIENGCDFCKTAHTATAKKLGVDKNAINEILENKEISDEKDKALIELAFKIMEKKGWLDEADIETFFAAGFAHQQVLEVILCVTIKTLSNYSNHITKPTPNPELVALANS